MEFFLQCHHEGQVLSPLLSVPGTTTSMIQLDWLHVVELGVGQDLCGNIFWQCLRRKAGGVLAGNNVDARLDSLNSMLRAYNKESRPPNPINKLTMGMVKRKSEPPKLRCKGGECRHVQPFCKSLALMLLQQNAGSEYFQHVLAAIDGLIACSAEVDKEPFNLHAFQKMGNEFVQHYFWLSQQDEDGVFFRVKPKMHQFLHLLHEVAPRHGSPNLYWNWADEGLGGRLSKVALRRGGKSTPSRISEAVLKRVAALAWVHQ